MNEIQQHIGKKIKEFRKSKRMPQTFLADALGISRASLCNMEAGKHGIMPLNMFMLCSLLSCTPNDLYPPITDEYQLEVQETTIMAPKVIKTITLKKIDKPVD